MGTVAAVVLATSVLAIPAETAAVLAGAVRDVAKRLWSVRWSLVGAAVWLVVVGVVVLVVAR